MIFDTHPKEFIVVSDDLTTANMDPWSNTQQMHQLDILFIKRTFDDIKIMKCSCKNFDFITNWICSVLIFLCDDFVSQCVR